MMSDRIDRRGRRARLPRRLPWALLALPLLAAGPGPDTVSAPATGKGSAGGSTGAAAALEVFEIVQVVPDVYAALVRPEPDAYAFANSLVVVGDEGVLVVDTQQSPTAARALVEEIRDLTDLPVRWVVNTHWHGDHVYGNQVYAEAFPGVHVVAHVATRRQMMGEGRDRWAEELTTLPESVEERRAWLESGRGPGGEPLSADDRTAVRRSLELRRAYLEDLRTLRWTPPDLTFRDRLTLHLGHRRVELIHVGPAHTTGDVVVHLPGDGVLAVGDLLEEGPPWLEGADLAGWAAALDRVAGLEATRVLPSHGGLHRDRSLLEWQAAFMRTLVDAAERAKGSPGAVERVVGALDTERFREAFASVGVEGEALREYLTAAAERVLRASNDGEAPGP